MDDFLKFIRFIIRYSGQWKPKAVTTDKLFSSGVNSEWFNVYVSSTGKVDEDTPMSCLWRYVADYKEAYGGLPSEADVRTYLNSDETLTEANRTTLSKAIRAAKGVTVDDDDLPLIIDQLQTKYLQHVYIINMSEQLDALDSDPEGAITACMAAMEAALASTRQSVVVEPPSTLRDLINRRDLLKPKDASVASIPASFNSWNRTFGGFKRGEIFVFSGLPKVGKSFIGHECAITAAMAGYRVVCAELELTQEQITHRMVARITGLPTKKIEEQQLTKPERKLYRAALKEVADAPWMDNILFLGAQDCLTPARLRNSINTHFDGRVDMILIDFLAMMQPSVRVNNSQAHDALREVIKEIKTSIAKAYNCAVVTMCHTKTNGDTQFKIVDELSDVIARLFMSPDRPYINPNLSKGEWVGTPGLIECRIDAARSGMQGVTMGVMIEYATAHLADANAIHTVQLGDHRTSHKVERNKKGKKQ